MVRFWNFPFCSKATHYLKGTVPGTALMLLVISSILTHLLFWSLTLPCHARLNQHEDLSKTPQSFTRFATGQEFLEQIRKKKYWLVE